MVLFQVNGGAEIALKRLMEALMVALGDYGIKLPGAVATGWPVLLSKDVGLVDVTLAQDDDLTL